jgi:hypothetical protein
MRMAVFGAGPAILGSAWERRTELDRLLPAQLRIEMYERELREQFHLLAQQAAEFEGNDRLLLEAEGIAVLIAIRELRRHFPELSD